ncbi:zinc carboxypeptidase, partial [Ostertagia ostertagi]
KYEVICRRSSKRLIQIGKKSERTKPAVWLDGGNPCSEWPAFHVAVYFIEQLVQRYKIDDKITGYVESLDIYIFPVLNPDGFVFSSDINEINNPSMEKEPCPLELFGVYRLRERRLLFSQLNYPFNNPCSDEFQGPFPFSEPESRAVRDFVLSKEVYGRLHALVSMHTHGQLWILPYNHHKRTYPEDFKELESLAARAAEESLLVSRDQVQNRYSRGYAR